MPPVNETRALRPQELQDDLDALAALKVMAGYAPVDTNLTPANLQATADDREGKETTHSQTIDAEKAARDNKVAAQWLLHNRILKAKKAVVGQFGEDSNEAQAVGLKKKSEKAKPKKKPATP